MDLHQPQTPPAKHVVAHIYVSVAVVMFAAAIVDSVWTILGHRPGQAFGFVGFFGIAVVSSQYRKIQRQLEVHLRRTVGLATLALVGTGILLMLSIARRLTSA